MGSAQSMWPQRILDRARLSRSSGEQGIHRGRSGRQGSHDGAEEAGTTKKPNFKDVLKQDVRNVFLNTGEFAENRTVYYDGEEYPDIPVVLEGPVQEKRDRLTDDHVRGLHMVTAVLYCAQEDMGGKVPKQGASLEIATREGGRFFQKYYVVASTSNMGMLHVELEAMAQ